jgi:hypothetical protein
MIVFKFLIITAATYLAIKHLQGQPLTALALAGIPGKN